MARKKKKKKLDSLLSVSACDGTSDIEISVTANEDYSTTIIKEANKAFNWKQIKKLENRNEDLLEEGKRQVIELFRNADRLTFHTYKYNVLFLIKAGRILNLIEEKLAEEKDKYAAWISESIGKKYSRKVNHAKQLAKMGKFAEDRAALGKNRLLQFDHARKIAGEETLIKLLKKYPSKDITEDMDEEEGALRTHVDAIINYYRFIDEKVDYATFIQAKNIATYLKKALEVNKIRKIKQQITLKNLTSEKDKREALNKFIKNMKVDGTCKLDKTLSMKSLGKILADLIEYVNDIGDGIANVLRQADDDTIKEVAEAKKVINKLAKTVKEVSATVH